MIAAPEWLEEVTRYWAPPPLLGGADWAERFRVLGSDESPKPGPWRCVYWQRGVLEAFADPSLDWVVVLKAAQMGVSELVRCAIGRWAMLDPGDVLWVMADELAANKAMKKLRKMFANSPELAGLVSDRRGDNTLKELILLNGMRVVIGWAGSAQSLSSDPFRYVVLDETGKYPTKVGDEADPVELAKERTKVYGRRSKTLILSTPSNQDDLIMAAWEETLDQQRFAFRCDSCGSVQALQWDQVRWPDGDPSTAPSDLRERLALAAGIEADQSAWIECGSCSGDMGHTPHEWIRADLDGLEPEGDGIRSRRRSLHVSELYHWETSVSDLVSKFLRRPVHKLQGFFNGSLGIPLRDPAGEIRGEMFRQRAIHPARVCPPWTVAVVATADTQIDHFWLVVRAWGNDGRSRLLDWGKVSGFEELEQRGRARFPVDGEDTMSDIHLLLVDSGGGMDTPDGSTTDLVYKWTKRRPRALPYKGDPSKDAMKGKTVWRSKVKYTPKKGNRRDPYEVELVEANANFWKDKLAALIRETGPVIWQECVGAEDPTYCRHMSSQHKVTETTPRGVKRYWKNKSKHGRHDLWDCSYMQCVAAEELGVDQMAPIAARSKVSHSYKSKPSTGWKIGR